MGDTTPTRSRILAVGRAVPDRVVTNEDLSRIMDTSDDWIEQRTGEDQHSRARPAKIAAHIIHWRDRDRLHSLRLERRVEAHRRLDVGHQDGDHAGGAVVHATASSRRTRTHAHAFPGRL